ncbi:unnamed protein product, partial [Staurois parvus]
MNSNKQDVTSDIIAYYQGRTDHLDHLGTARGPGVSRG